MERRLTEREALEAMRVFLAQFNEREPEGRRETIFSILAWTQTDDDGITADPAQASDWDKAVDDALAGRWVVL